ncbi:MAG: HEAT repeat domain-containing protein, partial [Phycisphaeraceae bacterium]|nr:HEAT repeat domain-containing protein [Phycisphaeraceae bacterium]
EEPTRRMLAVKALGTKQAEDKTSAIAALQEATGDEDEQTSLLAVKVLARMGPAAAGALNKAATDARDPIAVAALEALGQMGFREAPLESVAVMLSSDLVSAPIRTAAAHAAGRLYAWPTIDGLILAYQDANPVVRKAAKRAVEQIVRSQLSWPLTSVSPAAGPRLKQNLHHYHYRYSEWIGHVYRLALEGKKPSTLAVPRVRIGSQQQRRLLKNLKSNDEDQVRNTLVMLKVLDSPAVVLALHELARRPQSQLAGAAREALAERKKQKLVFGIDVKAWFEIEAGHQRRLAVYELATVHPDRVPKERLIEALGSDDDPQVRAAAAFVLGNRLVWSAMEKLISDGLLDPDIRVRAASAHAVMAMTGQWFRFRFTEDKQVNQDQAQAIANAYRRFKKDHARKLQALRASYGQP